MPGVTLYEYQDRTPTVLWNTGIYHTRIIYTLILYTHSNKFSNISVVPAGPRLHVRDLRTPRTLSRLGRDEEVPTAALARMLRHCCWRELGRCGTNGGR